MRRKLGFIFMTACLIAALADRNAPVQMVRAAETTAIESEATKQETRLEMQQVQAELNYAYVESEIVSTSEEQKILISAGSEQEIIKEAQLYYHKEGSAETLQVYAEQVSENTALFVLPYTKESQSGVYVLDKMEYTAAQEERMVVELSEEEIKYGVNCFADANPTAMIFNEEIETNVVTLDAEGNPESELSIAEALQNVGAMAAQNTEVMAVQSAGLSRSTAVTNTTKPSNMVIVLDPGHGGTDPGVTRTYNGVRYYERDIVLKIAEYCKEELENYAGVDVYLTRTDNTSKLMDRKERTEFAMSKGADVIISLHINSTTATATSVTGALVYCPYRNTDSGVVSQELANKILEKLAKLGLKNRGILIDEELGMIKYPKENGVPGILVEHAFMNNASDVLTYLSSDEKLKNLGVSDATAIAEFYKLEKKSDYITYEQGTGKMSVKANKEKTAYTVTVSGLPKAYDVQFAVWSNANGGADMRWYEMEEGAEGKWTGSFDISSFKESGQYNVHAYIVNANKQKVFSSGKAIKVTGPSVKSVSIKNTDAKAGTFQVVISGATSGAAVKKVQVKAYTKSNKADAYTYTAKKQSNGTYKATVNIKNHAYNFGTYKVQIYVTDVNGIKEHVKTVSKKLTKPDLQLKTTSNSSKTKYTITLKQYPGVKSVRAAVWSERYGQDDLRWYSAKKGSNGLWKATADIAKHKTAGIYYVHVYGKTATGKEIFLAGKTFKVTEPTIASLDVQKVNKSAGTFYVYARGITAKAGVKKVKVKAWTKADKSDLRTYTAARTSVGNYRVKINKKYHKNHTGTYTIMFYLTDNRGITVTKKVTQKL